MWAIRMLNGAQAGQVVPLKLGALRVGRGTECEVKIASASVSKVHANFHVTDDKLIIADLNSRNGTFVNGVRVQRQILKVGDKVMLHDVIFDVQTSAFPAGGDRMHPHSFAGSAAIAFPAPSLTDDPRTDADDRGAPLSARSLAEVGRLVRAYVDDVAMPGVYSVAKRAPFRYVIGAYVAGFVVLVTLLSTIPMAAVTKASVQAESQRRALTIARGLALVNRQSIVDGLDVSVTTQMAENEDGVESALILSAKDGRVIAPVNRTAYADKPYILRVRKKLRSDEVNDREYVEQIDSSKIVAAVPVKKFTGDGAGLSVVAYAVVVYDMGRLAVDGGETLSLLIQNLAIALGLGFVLYFLLAKTIERPIVALNEQLDDALREGKDDIYVEFQFPPLALLASNVNSALSRIGRSAPGDALGGAASLVDRDAEAEALVASIQAPALSVNALDGLINGANEALYGLIGGGVDLRRKAVVDIHDQAMQAHVRELIQRLREDPRARAQDSLPFSDGVYATSAVAISGAGEPAFFLIVFNKADGGG